MEAAFRGAILQDWRIKVHRELLPVEVVIPTRNRAAVLRRTLESLAEQPVQPARVVVVDASDDEATHSLCVSESIPGLDSDVAWCAAEVVGAASQRNQGVRQCTQPVIGFFDDDILLAADCFVRLWRALHCNLHPGGVNAMITNQHYHPLGFVSHALFRFMAGQTEPSYAGRVLGPAVNILPEDRDDLPEVVPVEWLNTTCTLYRREALPNPPFPEHFTGYSLMEDVALSLTVGKHWKLANARTARIHHDSQPGTHKSDPKTVAKMQLLNRHYVMTQIMGRNRVADYLKLIVYELFTLLSSQQSPAGRAVLGPVLRGKASAFWQIVNC